MKISQMIPSLLSKVTIEMDMARFPISRSLHLGEMPLITNSKVKRHITRWAKPKLLTITFEGRKRITEHGTEMAAGF